MHYRFSSGNTLPRIHKIPQMSFCKMSLGIFLVMHNTTIAHCYNHQRWEVLGEDNTNETTGAALKSCSSHWVTICTLCKGLLSSLNMINIEKCQMSEVDFSSDFKISSILQDPDCLHLFLWVAMFPVPKNTVQVLYSFIV